MSTQRPHRIDRDTAEQLLAGAAGRPGAGHEPVARLLAAAAAPARDEELRGELAAMTAFRAARLAPATDVRRPSMLKIALAKLLTVKAGAVLAVTAAGGAALATTTGAVPNPLTSDKVTVAPDKSRPAPTKSHPSAAGKAGDSSPSPSLTGLCRAYAAKKGEERGKSLDSSAFTVLVAAAGSKDKVEAYCVKVLAEDAKRPSHGPSDRPANGNGASASADRPGNGRPSENPGTDNKPADPGSQGGKPSATPSR